MGLFSKDTIKLSNRIDMYSYFNKSSNIVFMAGKSCYKGKIDNITYDQIYKFINNRIEVGHESIIEHSNFFVAFKISKNLLLDLSEILSCCKYLNAEQLPIYDRKKKKETVSILVNIGGSIRGWKHIYRTIKNLSNPILHRITKEIYKNLPKAYFTDFIKDGIFEEDKFCYIDEDKTAIPKYSDKKLDYCIPEDTENKIKLINIDSQSDLEYYIPANYIIGYSLPDMLTITVRFKGLARYSTHQLVRHRNAITQESMRYVDFSNYQINNPMIYNKDYDPNKKYKIESPYITFPEEGITADELCKALQPIYKCLHDQGMKPEEARGFTVNAIDAGSLYMTFTYRTLCKFFELRMDRHAQGEIRTWADTLFDYIKGIDEIASYMVVTDMLSPKIILPRYKNENKEDISYYSEEETESSDDPYNKIDEDMTEEEFKQMEEELNKGIDKGDYIGEDTKKK